MLKSESIVIDGRAFVHTWSDIGMKIERDGEYYNDAYDPAEFGRTYTETDIQSDGAEATEEDYLAALDKLGVSADE